MSLIVAIFVWWAVASAFVFAGWAVYDAGWWNGYMADWHDNHPGTEETSDE